tara:strand:- start:824 stop:2029 length:1206 start_codon:yes stop_codon:yes gene_type:complete
MALDPSIILSGKHITASSEPGLNALKMMQELRRDPLRNELLQQNIDIGEKSLATGQQKIDLNQQILEEKSLEREVFGANKAIAAWNRPGGSDVAGVLDAIRTSFPNDEEQQANHITEFRADPKGFVDRLSDDVAAYKAQKTINQKKGLFSATTKQYPDGTVQMVAPDGSLKVFTSDQKEVFGTDAEAAIKKARDEEVAFAQSKSEAKKKGASTEEVARLEADKQARFAFTKSKSAFQDSISQTVSSIGSAKATNEIMKDTVTEIKSFISGMNAGFGASLKRIGPTNARKLKGLLDTMKANSAFGTLIDLKNSGGTLGAISATELELLAAKLGSLDQHGMIPEQIRVLDQILAQNQGSIDRMETSFSSEKDRFSRGFGEQAQAPQQNSGKTRLDELRAKAGF